MTDRDASGKEESESKDTGAALLGQTGGMMGPDAKVCTHTRSIAQQPAVTIRAYAGDGNPAGFTLTLIGDDLHSFVRELVEAEEEAVDVAAEE